MADYFDRLETELRAAVPRTSARPQRLRLTPGSLVVAISIAVTAAVVVLAIALIGHARQAAHTAAQSSPHAVRDVLGSSGVGAVKFGQSRVAVIAALTPLLGPTSTGYTRVQGECGVDHTMTWPNWSVASAHGVRYPFDPVLTAFFWHSRFVGYQYGEFDTKAAPRAASRGTVLATSRGLNIGDTLARGRQIYGGAFRLSSAQGGVWKAGRLRGYAWGSPNSRAVSVHSVVATIDAGDVGCPALSP